MTITEPLKLRLGAPVPRSPVMVDYHSLPDPVIATRLKEALELLKLHGVQLLPADVTVKSDDVRRYWLLRIHNEIACMDPQRSVCTYFDNGSVLGIDKLVLDEQVLREIPLEQRLVFCLAESSSVSLFHQSIVDLMLALKPEGLRFIRVDQWNDGAGFRP
jgi:hypothetical protein